MATTKLIGTLRKLCRYHRDKIGVPLSIFLLPPGIQRLLVVPVGFLRKDALI
jgi:hypothetical protein